MQKGTRKARACVALLHFGIVHSREQHGGSAVRNVRVRCRAVALTPSRGSPPALSQYYADETWLRQLLDDFDLISLTKA
jgi:hypothetical protein